MISLHCAAMSDVPESPPAASYQIGEIAGRVGLSQRTIRHYDDLGIIKPSARTVGGFRLYTEADVRRFQLIKPFKPLGIGLDGVRAVIEALDVLDAPGSDAVALSEARARIESIIELIAERRQELEEAIQMSTATVAELHAAVESTSERLAPAPTPGR